MNVKTIARGTNISYCQIISDGIMLIRLFTIPQTLGCISSFDDLEYFLGYRSSLNSIKILNLFSLYVALLALNFNLIIEFFGAVYYVL